MDYERKYKELVTNFKYVLNLRTVKESGTIPTEDVRKLIPELQTSNDGEIIKELITYLDVQDTLAKGKDSDFKNWIAWLKKQNEKEPDIRSNYLEELIAADDIYQMAMNDAMLEEAKNKAIDALSKLEISKLLGIEKQREQNPADKVEQKFNVGDWVVDNDSGTIQHIKEIVTVNDETLYVFDEDSVLDINFQEQYHLWNIQDAKKGDVLQANKCTLIFDSLTKDIDGNTVISSWYFCDTKTFYGWRTSQSDLWSIEGVVPATKEQRDILFSKMKEAGYEWDEKKKELKKIEYVKESDKTLLDLIRKDVEKDIEHSAVEFAKSYMEDVNPSFEKVQESEELWKWKMSCLRGVNKAYTKGKEDALKSLPKWKKITEVKQNYLAYGYLSHDGYYLSIQELKDKLPKE